ncbi:uncharacterized protein A1O5_07787 [Cladophialophora psammophila CBS 110553]|uniref:Protein NRD1 n=1 Tax=Cladophialophora psammophila CBS 110553 TaxID=1182543 RepID=W9WV09_9EURO|nr:uncharacterized protein A1O5_07787 [Cladophialophora psammophila CBS 110553]EXJ68855.1 hypothetical protein A1O5_07787 [Cladophialophora psammophila CBS 110553]
MSSAVAELDSILQSMLNLKPPGVSGSKITAITSLCTANIQSESVLIQKIYTHFKKTPGTHKLGVLYVIDSVTRQWVDQARKSGQQLGSGAPDGTFAAGVTRVTELLPVLMNDIIATAPEDQKVKIRKLLEIWERSNTFPAPLLASLKEKLDAPKGTLNIFSTTPEGSPSPGFVPLGKAAPTDNMTAKPPQQQDTSAILEALKNMAKQNTTAAPAIPAPAQTSLNNLLGAQNGIPLTSSTVNPSPAAAAASGQAVNQLGALFAGLSNGAQSQSPANVPANPLAAFLPQQAPAPAVPQNPPLSQDAQAQAQVQLQLLQLLASQGVPPDQWATALQLLNMQGAAGGGGGGASASGLPFPPPVPTSNWAGQVQVPGASRDAQTRSPPGQFRRRSRSPGYDRRRDLSPRRRRDSPGADGYRNDRDGRRGEYRQRSPMGRKRRSPTPPGDYKLPPPGPKNVQWDPTLPKGHIKVFSRTLFVGGVTSSEAHLRSLFGKFGVVQTCIVNIDKRHAFIKMINRQDAESAREGMEEYKVGDMQLRTKWGVGFGPRDCSDYQTGISVIPIERLTDADRKWLLTAEYGGTGGAPIQEGMVVEEPDIEIGAGVSSKAMSRRIATDQGGRRGPQSSRQHVGRDDTRYRDSDRRMDRDDRQASGNPNDIGVMPSMAFPMNFGNMPNAMPGFPPGFQMPAFQPQSKQD